MGQALLLVFVGGGIGSLCRYGIARWMAPWSQEFPWATMTANVVSCVILGLTVGWVIKHQSTGSLTFFIITGFCGGFSTFSTFSYDTLRLLENAQYVEAMLYVGGSVLLCLICVFIGLKIFSIIW